MKPSPEILQALCAWQAVRRLVPAERIFVGLVRGHIVVALRRNPRDLQEVPLAFPVVAWERAPAEFVPAWKKGVTWWCETANPEELAEEYGKFLANTGFSPGILAAKVVLGGYDTGVIPVLRGFAGDA